MVGPHFAAMRVGSGSRRWWLAAGAAFFLALVAGTWKLVAAGTRGAEIANVLALRFAVLGVLAAAAAVLLAEAARNLPGEVGPDGEARREAKGQEANKTNVGGLIGLPGIGRPTPRQRVFAAAVVLISFGVVLMVAITGPVTTVPAGPGPVTTIPGGTNQAITIPVGAGPRGVGVTPDGRHAYVTNLASSKRVGDRHRHQHCHRHNFPW